MPKYIVREFIMYEVTAKNEEEALDTYSVKGKPYYMGAIEMSTNTEIEYATVEKETEQ